MHIVELMLLSLAKTIVLEVAFAVICSQKNKRFIGVNVLCNTLTNPVVTFVYYFMSYGLALTASELLIFLIILEASAIIVEGYVYKMLTDIRRPFVFSLSANLFSYFSGLIINTFIWEMLL